MHSIRSPTQDTWQLKKNNDSVNKQASLQHGTALSVTHKSDLFTAEPLCKSRWLHLSRRRVTFTEIKSDGVSGGCFASARRDDVAEEGASTETEEREAKLMTRHKAGPSKFDERWEREGKSLMWRRHTQTGSSGGGREHTGIVLWLDCD